ncbi:MAG: S8 family serine peptidase [Candidatus Odinarchaeota archaeon]
MENGFFPDLLHSLLLLLSLQGWYFMKKWNLLACFTVLIILLAVYNQYSPSRALVISGNPFNLSVHASSPSGLSWNLQLVHASEAWQITNGSTDVIVAIIDTGIDFNHPELQHAIWENPGESPGNGLDDDGNGYPDDVHGWDFYNNDPDPADDYYHGTFIAGIISALHDGLMTDGLASNITLIPIKYLNENNQGSSWTAFENAVDYAVTNGADIISISIQTEPGQSPPESFHQKLIAAETAGVLLVSVTGNHNYYSVSYPGRYDSVIAVTAVDWKKERALFADYGPETELAAPGVAIESTTLINAGSSIFLSINQQLIPSYPLEFTTKANLTDIQLINAGFGLIEDFEGLDVSGKVALISRGNITFREKAANAYNKGATAAIIYNNQFGVFSDWTLDENPVSIPVVAISQEDGLSLVEKLSLGQDLHANLSFRQSNYTTASGTSFAAPHVAATAALMLSANPSLKSNPDIVRLILGRTATDLGDPGRDDLFGWGLLDSGLAVKAATDTEPPSIRFFFEPSETGEVMLHYTLFDTTGVYNASVHYHSTAGGQPWQQESLLPAPTLNASLLPMQSSLGEFQANDMLEYYFTLEDLSNNTVTYPVANISISDITSSSGTAISSGTTETVRAFPGNGFLSLLALIFPVLVISNRKKRKLGR